MLLQQKRTYMSHEPHKPTLACNASAIKIICIHSLSPLQLPHIHNAPNAVAGVHVVECVVDAAQVLAMGDELVDLELAVHIVVDEIAHLRAALDAAEGAALPYAAGDELECWKFSCQCEAPNLGNLRKKTHAS